MSFTHDLHILAATRQNILGILDQYSLAQVNTIPKGFGNNLIWNAGHCWVTQVLLVQALAGLEHNVSSEHIAAYRKGSRPAGPVSQNEVDFIKEALVSSQQILNDLLNQLYTGTYKTYTTSYGTTLSSLAEGVRFNNVHEGLHYGTMLALRKFV